jgi:hypothetical protein
MEDIRNETSRANGALNQPQKTWNSSATSLTKRLRIFNSNVKSILLYGCETRRATQEICKKKIIKFCKSMPP